MNLIISIVAWDRHIYQGVTKKVPGSSSQPKNWYNSTHANKCVDIEHGRTHLITSQCCISLTSAREITSDDNDSQGTPSTLQRVWMDELKSNTRGIIWSEVYDVNPLPNARKPTIEACRSQGTNWFLSLVPGWCTEVEGNRLVKGWSWCICHHRHEINVGKWWIVMDQMSVNWHKDDGKWHCIGWLPSNIWWHDRWFGSIDSSMYEPKLDVWQQPKVLFKRVRWHIGLEWHGDKQITQSRDKYHVKGRQNNFH